MATIMLLMVLDGQTPSSSLTAALAERLCAVGGALSAGRCRRGAVGGALSEGRCRRGAVGGALSSFALGKR